MVDAFTKLGHEVRVLALVAPRGAHDADAGDRTSRGRRFGALLKRAPGVLYEAAEVGYNLKGYLDTSRAIRDFRPDFVYDRYVLFNGSVVAASRRAGVPVFLEVNSPYAFQRAEYEKLALRRLARWSESRVWQWPDRVLVVSSPLRDYLLGAGVAAERIEVMPNGVDLDHFDPDPAPPRHDDALVIGFVGSLRRWHGVDLLLRAAAPLVASQPNLRVVIAGDGEMRAALEAEAARLGISGSTRFLGQISRQDMRDVVARFDIAVSPRTIFYQSPMKIVEYMAMRRAIVAPDTGNIHDLITHDAEGLLFRPDDVGALQSALQRLVSDDGLRRRLGERAREAAERRLTWIGNARRVIALYEGIAGARRA